MRYGLTLACEAILTIVIGILTQDFFVTCAIVIMSTLIIYMLWDKFFNMIEEDKKCINKKKC